MSAKSRAEVACYLAFVAIVMIMPLFMDEFGLNRFAKFLIFGMLGTAIALSWGYSGILNLGQGLSFGLGAYMLAMSLKLASETSLRQGADHPLPDFMFWNAEPGAPAELCCITKASFLWLPFQSQWFGALMGIAVPSLVAFALASLLFRKRIAGVFISIVTLALVLLVRLLVINAQSVTNGFNGLTDLGWLTVGSMKFDPFIVPTYYLVATIVCAAVVTSRLLVRTRAGLVLQAIRDDQTRARYLGFDVPSYQVFFFVVSAAMSGVAGMLYVVVSEFASPTFMDVSFSITMVVWAAVGGRSSLLGACIGAILIKMIEAGVSETESLLEAWKAIIGLIFILVVLFAPRGLAGVGNDLVDRFGSLRRRPLSSRKMPDVRDEIADRGGVS
ncbi:urea transport system permease protein [Bradyrhizobium sp. USDA 4341]